MATNKVILGGVTKIDLTDKTVAANTMLNGTTSLDRSGAAITGNIASQSGSTVTPTESVQTAVPANTYTTGAVQVGAIPSNYVGSGVPQRTSADLTVAGTTVTAPAGYYASAASAQADGTDYIVTMSKNQNDEWTTDRTYAQIYAAYLAGKNIITEITTEDENDVEAVHGFFFDGSPDHPSYFRAYIFEQFGGSREYLYTDYTRYNDEYEYRVEVPIYDTYYADAIASDVRAGKIFYTVSGQETGTAPTRTASDLTASGATVTVPAGIYDSQVTKAIANGSATTPATTITANPTISVNSSGLITASTSATQSVTPTVSAGYVSSGTAGTVTVSGSKTQQLTTQAGTTITPTESEQTAVAAQRYTTGAVKVAAIPSNYVGSGIPTMSSSDLTVSGDTVTAPAGYYASPASKAVASGTAGTPTATKSAVSNHAVTVTPSVTNTTGYITGGTKTGTAVSVTAAELVSGTLTISSSGTKDVTNYASATVAAGTEGTPTATKGAVSNHSVTVTPSVTNSAGYITGSTKTGTAVTVTAAELVSGTKSITANGSSIDVTDYQYVDVNVSGGGGVLVEDTLDANGGIIRTITAADVVTVGQKTITQNGTYVASDDDYDGYSQVTVNVPGSGVDIPVFSLTWNNDWSQVLSVTCNKTYAECLALINNNIYGGYVNAYTQGSQTIDESYPANFLYSDADQYHDSLRYMVTYPPYGDISFRDDGVLTFTNPSSEEKSSSDITVSGATVTVPAGYYASQVTKSVASGTAGTPTATKGAVSNHSVTVTPSVTNSTGYITGGTKTGTGVTVSASELVSGSQTITDNGTVNVTNLASVNVQIPFVTYYTGTTDPSPGLGSNGDIYLKVVS